MLSILQKRRINLISYWEMLDFLNPGRLYFANRYFLAGSKNTQTLGSSNGKKKLPKNETK